MAFIEVTDLVKEYKVNVKRKGLLGAVHSLLIPEYEYKRAVDGINFSIEKGEMVGFIGPNGAGKSTTVKMLVGILVQNSGTINIGGLSPYKDRKKNASRIGVVFGQRTQLWWDLPVRDTFDILKHVYKIPQKKFEKNIELFNDLLRLNDFINTPVRQLSLGQKMRADIAASLLHEPEIVFFDEPTIGLDVVAKENIREFIKEINKEKGTTMLFTTHDMIDIEKTCKKMIIIDKGTIIYNGTVEEIKDKYSSERVLEVHFDKKYNDIEIPNVKVADKDGNKKLFQFNKHEIQMPNLISDLTQKYCVLDLKIHETDIDSIIRGIYQGGIKPNENVFRGYEKIISEQHSVPS